MKILQINNCHYRRGGADVVYLNTGTLLEKRGHKVVYFSQRNNENISLGDDSHFIDEFLYLDGSPLKKMMAIPRFIYSKESANKLQDLINTENPEIAHIHTYKGVLTPSILRVLKRNMIPVVLTIHDYGLLCPNNRFLNGNNNICTKCLDRKNSFHCVLNKCNRGSLVLSTISSLEYTIHQSFFEYNKYFDHLIAVSKFAYKLHSDDARLTTNISHIYNFVPKSNTTLNVHRGEYVLFHGRLSHEKGIFTLLRAWAMLDKHALLKIAGDGPLRNEIIEFIEENNLSNVELVGFQGEAELFDMISRCSFVIVPSEWYENNPLSILEAYSLGKPVIGARIAGIPEIIIEGKTGFLFESRDYQQLYSVLKLVVGMPTEKYIDMSLDTLKYFRNKFSEEEHYTRLIDVFEKVMYKKK